MDLILAEKPSVAMSIAKVVGAHERKDGYFKGNGYFVSWAFGHLIRLANPEELLERNLTVEDLPFLPAKIDLKLKDDSGTKKQYKILKGLFEKSQTIISATDAGREGELIFWHIYNFINIERTVKRLWISSVNEEVIANGLNNLLDSEEKKELYISGHLRQIADWYVGFNASILMTRNNNFLLKLGRVKSPTLFLVTKRYLENKSFKPQKYFSPELKVQNSSNDSLWIKYDEKVFSEYQNNEILQKLNSNKIIRLDSIEEKELKSNAPTLFNLAEVQKAANKKFSYTADVTLSIVQKLYEAGYVTYPRTDSKYLNEEMKDDVFSIISQIPKDFDLSDAEIQKILELKYDKPFNNEKVTDHHAIIITKKIPVLENLDLKEKNIYLLLLTSFLQAFAPTNLKNQVIYHFKHENIDTNFIAKGTTVKDEGYVFWDHLIKTNTKQKDKKATDDAGVILPVFEKKEYPILDMINDERFTTAPPLLNDATLITQMETCGKEIENEEHREALMGKGIGTSATRAGIIKDLVDGEYIERINKSIIPTKLGFELIKLLNGQKIISPELTGEWENILMKIENKEVTEDLFLSELNKYTVSLIADLKRLPKLKYNPNELHFPCPKCNKHNLSQNKNTYFCGDPSCSFTIFKNFRGAKISETILGQLMTKGISSKVTCKTQEGKKYQVQLSFNKSTFKVEPLNKQESLTNRFNF